MVSAKSVEDLDLFMDELFRKKDQRIK